MQLKDVSLLEQSLYADLYRQHAPALFAYAYQHTASREDAEDIVVDVFLSILQNQGFPDFNQEKQRAWLWTIARNKVVDHYRHSTRATRVSIEWLAEPLYEDEMLSPEQVSMRHEEFAQLYQAVGKLPAVQQEVLRLRFGHGLKCDEIAPVLHKSGPAIRMLLTRTLRSLRTLYKDWGKVVSDDRT